MSTFAWFPANIDLNELTDADKLPKAVEVMRGAADLFTVKDGHESIEITDNVCTMMYDLLNSAADLTLDIASRLAYKHEFG